MGEDHFSSVFFLPRPSFQRMTQRCLLDLMLQVDCQLTMLIEVFPFRCSTCNVRRWRANWVNDPGKWIIYCKLAIYCSPGHLLHYGRDEDRLRNCGRNWNSEVTGEIKELCTFSVRTRTLLANNTKEMVSRVNRWRWGRVDCGAAGRRSWRSFLLLIRELLWTCQCWLILQRTKSVVDGLEMSGN